jgi:sulfofructose kinase
VNPRLLMVGLSCLDHIWQVERFPPQGSRTPATGYRTQGGGPAATAAVTAARLGAEVSLWAVHGDDAAGRAALAELETYGVNLSGVRVVKGVSSFVSAVLVAPSGERYIFPYYSPGLDDDPSWPGWDVAGLEGVDCVLTDARHPRLAEAVLKEAKRRGIPTVGDFSNARNWHLAAYLDYLIVSEECAQEVLGYDDPEAALEGLRQRQGQLVGITLGEQGFLYDDPRRGETRHIPAFHVEVVDTTGAGDVFHGAYAYGVARGWTPDRSGLFASVTAAMKCTALGGRSGIPCFEEVETLLIKKTAKEMNARKWT